MRGYRWLSASTNRRAVSQGTSEGNRAKSVATNSSRVRARISPKDHSFSTSHSGPGSTPSCVTVWSPPRR